MVFGTDDEKALITGFKNTFDRSINLLCEIHLKKNAEKKLQEIGITGKIKGDIVADIFGRNTGSVYEFTRSSLRWHKLFQGYNLWDARWAWTQGK